MNYARFRFILTALLFFISLLVVLPAPTLFFWHFTILSTEFGHWLVAIVILVGVFEWWAKAHGLKIFTLGVAAATAFLFLWPLLQAVEITRALPRQLTQAFGPGTGTLSLPATPLEAATLWSFPSTHNIQETTLHNGAAQAPAGAIEFYRDQQPGLEPCLLMVHGGGWNSGDEKQLSAFSRVLASHGCRVASVSYRLSPAFTWPAPKEDVTEALTYLKAHAAELGINAQEFIFFGRSAGGQIALATAYALHDPAIKGCIALYAPTDMVFAYRTGSDTDILHSRMLVRAFMGGDLEKKTDAYTDASPMDLADSATPPTLLIHGTRDELVWVRHSQRLRDRLTALKRPVFFLELPWATHAYDFNPNGPGGQLTVYAMIWFINAVTSPPTT